MVTDFVELALYCQNKYKESLESSSRYKKTLFVAIDEDNNVHVSTTPHILKNASKCILIHEKQIQPATNWYSQYKVEYINEFGEVKENRIDDEFQLEINWIGRLANQWMFLTSNKNEYYSCQGPWETNIKKIWELYCRLKNVKTDSERTLISTLYIKDEKILEQEKKIEDFSFLIQSLKETNESYKKLLDEIKDLVDAK